MDKRAKLELITTVMIVCYGVAIIGHYICGSYLGWGFPFDSFLYTPDDKFRDFLNVLDYKFFFKWLYHNDNGQYAMFPVMSWLIAPFAYIKNHNISLAVFLVISVIFISVTTWVQTRLDSMTLNVRNSFVLVFMSYPVLFIFDRANFEVFVYILLFAFVFLYSHKWDFLSVPLLSLAICLKIFPAVFLILFISDRKYGKAIITVLLSIGLTIIPLCFSDIGMLGRLHEISHNLDNYNNLYAIKDAGLDYGHSAFGLFKLILYKLNMHDSVAGSMRPYALIVICLFMLISAYVVFVEKEPWKKVALLVAAMCLFPHVSGDYKLLHFYIPMFLFLNTAKKEKLDFWYAFLFSLLFIPISFRISRHFAGSFIDPILIAVFMLLIISTGISKIRREELMKDFNEHIQSVKKLFRFGQA